MEDQPEQGHQLHSHETARNHLAEKNQRQSYITATHVIIAMWFINTFKVRDIKITYLENLSNVLQD